MAEFKSYTAKKMASLPEETKADIAKIGKHLRKFAKCQALLLFVFSLTLSSFFQKLASPLDEA